ncbi:hypothetical protein Ddye_026352 [Dipteronia dyeriana]|uniref:RNase H type-1 domain-containing protein n=1 Tax=Dipteronia dyeriana TaxID=168575 RepID=A0AAD9TM20_9ROSI|nr:hypothetical protein Ddye_026352 [Dipteronia dyeriana]
MVNRKTPHPESDLHACATYFLMEFRGHNREAWGRPMGMIKQVPRWVAPSEGLFKINTDVALRVVDNVSSIGVVIRDWKGRVRLSFCLQVSANLDPQIMEALAILRGIRLALSMGLVPACVESDALTALDAIRSQVRLLLMYG